MDHQIAIRRAAAALEEARKALATVVPAGHAKDLWSVTQMALREELLKAWLWETVEGQHLFERRVGVDELWAAWAQLWGLEPSTKDAGGYPRRVWTQAVSMLPNEKGVCLGPRTAKRGDGGKVQRFWIGFRMITRGSA